MPPGWSETTGGDRDWGWVLRPPRAEKSGERETPPTPVWEEADEPDPPSGFPPAGCPPGSRPPNTPVPSPSPELSLDLFLASSHGGDLTTKLLEKFEDVPLFFPFLVLEDPLGGILNLDLDELV